MKTILVPTDFSKCSCNAINYATALANKSNAKIILLHVYHVPVPSPETSLNPLTISEFHEVNIKRMKKMTDFELIINDKPPILEIEYEAVAGFAVTEIIEAAKKHDAGLIVMGTQGASNLTEIIMGSITAHVIAKSTVPVLAVPLSAKYIGLNKIVLAADLHEIKNNSTLSPLLEIALLFDSEILIFSVLKSESDMPTAEQTFEYLNLDKYLERVTHSLHTEVSHHIPDAIEKFALENHADLLVTLPQKHNYLQLLFNKSSTRNLVFHSHTPLLSLPE